MMNDAAAAYKRGDYATAYRLLKLLAEQGNAQARYALGSMYYKGEGVPQDFAEAMKWLRQAADQGNAPAQGALGSMYYRGEGVPQDYAEAMKWYREAAEQGNAFAQNFLGYMYQEGIGVSQDYVMAYMWFNLATLRFTASQKGGREKAIGNRVHVAFYMSHAQIAEAQKLAREWKPKKER